MGLIAGGMVGASVVGGLLGNSAASKAMAQQQAMAQAAFAQYANMGVPPDLAKQLVLQQYQKQGTLTPELEQNINLAASQAGAITEDPSLRANQMDVLNTLGQQSRGGLQAGDRAAYNELRANTQQDAEAKRQQILQQMQAQGQTGSGASLMAQLQGAQGASNQQSAGADRLAAQSSNLANQALQQRAQQAGQMRQQDFGVNQARANALDSRNQMMYQNSVAAQQRNVGTQNQAQAANLAASQNIANANVGQNNAEQQRQVQAQQQMWQDKLNLASAKANALNGQGTLAQQAGQQQANMYTGMGNALAQGIGAYGQYASKQPAASTGSNAASSGTTQADLMAQGWG